MNVFENPVVEFGQHPERIDAASDYGEKHPNYVLTKEVGSISSEDITLAIYIDVGGDEFNKIAQSPRCSYSASETDDKACYKNCNKSFKNSSIET